MKKNLASESSAIAEVVSSALEDLGKVETGIASDAPTLTSAEKRRATKPRKGGEHIVGQVAAVMKEHKMESGAFDIDAMVEHQDIANKLAPLEARLTKLLAQVTARRFEAGSAAWQTALECYAMLQRRAQRDGALAENIAPIEAFFAYRHHEVLDGKPTKLQTRAKAQLARAEKLVAHARSRVGAIDSSPSAAQPPAPVAPVAVAAEPPPVTQMYVPKSNGALNGNSNGAANGMADGTSAGG